MTGRTPPGNVKPFNSGVAAFVLMAPEDLAQEDIKEEFECEDAATCPACKKLLDQYAVRVELVDEAGAVLPMSAGRVPRAESREHDHGGGRGQARRQGQEDRPHRGPEAVSGMTLSEPEA